MKKALTLALTLTLCTMSALNTTGAIKPSTQPTIITDPGGGGTTSKLVASKADSWIEYGGGGGVQKRMGCSWNVYLKTYSGTTLVSSTWQYATVTYGSWTSIVNEGFPSCPKPV